MGLWLPPADIGRRIRQLREAKGMTQAELSDALGLARPGGPTQVSGWERGRGASEQTLQKIADYAGISVRVFQAEPEEGPQPPLSMEAVLRLRQQMKQVMDLVEEMRTVLEDSLGGAMSGVEQRAALLPTDDPRYLSGDEAEEAVDLALESGLLEEREVIPSPEELERIGASRRGKSNRTRRAAGG